MKRTLSVLTSMPLGGLRPLLWQGQPVYYRHAQIRAFLEKTFGPEYGDFLAEPSIPDSHAGPEATARWVSSSMNDPVPFTELGEREQAEAGARVNAIITAIEEQALELAGNQDNEHMRKFGEILSLAVEVPSLEHVFVQGDQISLACWGFTVDKSERTVFSLKQAVAEMAARAGAPSLAIKAIAPESQAVYEAVLEAEPETESGSETAEQAPPQEAVQEREPDPMPVPEEEPRPHVLLWVLLVLLLLILAILAGYYWYSHLRTPDPILPETPGMAAPDPDRIVVDRDNPLGASFAQNRLLIHLDPGVDPETFARDLAGVENGDMVQFLGFRPEMNIIQVELAGPEGVEVDLDDWIRRIEAMDGVDLVTREMLRQNSLRPTDPGFSETAVEQAWWLDQIQAPAAWDESRGSPDIRIAVIDSGFDLSHPELQGKVAAAWNVITRNASVAAPHETMAHGTHVASIAAGNDDNGQGVCGVCPDCSLILIRAADDSGWFGDAMILDALQYAARQGARVINLSVGMSFPDLEAMLASMSPAEQEAAIREYMAMTDSVARSWEAVFSRLADQGIIVVQAAGNEAIPTVIDPMKRVSSTIVVGATTPAADRAVFSNYGTGVTLSAPGEHVFSAVPGGFTYMDGTSMASPAVAGAVGWLLSTQPNLDLRSVTQFFTATGLPVRELNAPDYIGPIIQLAQGTPPEFDFPYTPNPQPEQPLEPGQDCVCGDDLDSLRDMLPPPGQTPSPGPTPPGTPPQPGEPVPPDMTPQPGDPLPPGVTPPGTPPQPGEPVPPETTPQPGDPVLPVPPAPGVTPQPGDTLPPHKSNPPDLAVPPEGTQPPGELQPPQEPAPPEQPQEPGQEPPPDDSGQPGDAPPPEDTPSPGDEPQPGDTPPPGDVPVPGEDVSPGSQPQRMPDGLYRSVQDVPNKDGKLVALYLELSGMNGALNLVEEGGALCRSSMRLQVLGEAVRLVQTEPARCTGTASYYEPYTFECTPQGMTTARCSVTPLSGDRNGFMLTMEQVDTVSPADPSSNYLNPVE